MTYRQSIGSASSFDAAFGDVVPKLRLAGQAG
jgi:hypothetical protein